MNSNLRLITDNLKCNCIDFSYILVELTEIGTITWNFHILSVLCHIKYVYDAYITMYTFPESLEIPWCLVAMTYGIPSLDDWYRAVAMKCSNSKCIC